MTREEVSDEAAEVGQAGDARVFESEGGLSPVGGRSLQLDERPPFSSRRWRLKRSVDLFEAQDGAIYLLRDGAGDDFVLQDPANWERLMLQQLAQGFVVVEQLHFVLSEGKVCGDALEAAVVDLRRSGLIEQPAIARLRQQDRQRYDRQLIYFGDLGDGENCELLQERLLEAHVVLLGCGGLGCWTASALAGAGIGHLTLVDDDRVALSNLNRQLLFGEADIGKAKVDVAAQALAGLNSALEISTVRDRVMGVQDVAALLDGVDLLIATADWPPHELPRWINEACLAAGVPYITAGQFPPRLRVGPLVIPGRTACLECQERQARKDHPLYDEIARHRSIHPATAATIGALSGLVGSMLAMEAIHLLSGVVAPATLDRALMIDAKTMEMHSETIDVDPLCPSCSIADGAESGHLYSGNAV